MKKIIVLLSARQKSRREFDEALSSLRNKFVGLIFFSCRARKRRARGTRLPLTTFVSALFDFALPGVPPPRQPLGSTPRALSGRVSTREKALGPVRTKFLRKRPEEREEELRAGACIYRASVISGCP